MIFKNNATYRFICRADTGRALNVYASAGTAPSLSNVCLWTSSSSDMGQQWIYKESGSNQYFVCKANPSVALDMYTGSTAGQNNVNAHVYAPSTTSYLAFEDTDSGYIKIKLARYSNKYLTANQGNNGTSNGRTTHDAGNVYWYAGGLTDHSQEWKPVLVDDGGSVDPEPDSSLTHDVIISKPSNTYLSQRNDNTWTGLEKVCSLSRLKGYGCSAVSATMIARIMEKNASITTKNLYDWGVWSVSDGYPWALWTQNSSSQLHFKFSDATRVWSSAKQLIFDEIMANRPVLIWLKNDSNNGTHFVVAYGLKAGASKTNLQYNQIMVYNPDPTGAVSDGTLKDMMANSLWKDFGSVRTAIPK